MQKTDVEIAGSRQSSKEFLNQLQLTLQKSLETGRPFLVIMLQIANMTVFKNQRPAIVVQSFYRELFAAIRKAVHPNQYVGYCQDGLGLIFEGVETGQVDVMARRLVMLTQHVIKSGHYNDLSSRWTDIIYQFLWPNKPGIIYPCIGWSVYPRDGSDATELVKRAFHHIAELRR